MQVRFKNVIEYNCDPQSLTIRVSSASEALNWYMPWRDITSPWLKYNVMLALRVLNYPRKNRWFPIHILYVCDISTTIELFSLILLLRCRFIPLHTQYLYRYIFHIFSKRKHLLFLRMALWIWFVTIRRIVEGCSVTSLTSHHCLLSQFLIRIFVPFSS